jgi:hypothetical protein
MSLNREQCAAVTFNDTTHDVGMKWMAEFGSHSGISFTNPLTYGAFHDVPVSYMFTELDQIIAPETQQKMLDNMQAEMGPEKKVNVFKYNVGHFPHITQPASVLDCMEKALQV